MGDMSDVQRNPEIDPFIPYAYREDYRRACTGIWLANDWSQKFRRAVEDLAAAGRSVGASQDEIHHLKATSGAYEEEVLQLRSKVNILEQEISRLIEREWVLVAQERYKAADQIRKLETKIDRAKEVLA